MRPCPRLVLVCCAALVTRGLETEGLFLEEAPLDLVQFLIGSFQEGVMTAAIQLPTCIHLRTSMSTASCFESRTIYFVGKASSL